MNYISTRLSVLDKHVSSLQQFVNVSWRGFALAMVVALASRFLSEHYNAPTMLFALLIGLALSSMSEQTQLADGLIFSSKQLLQLGVGLLGIQLSFQEVSSLGLISFLTIFGLVIGTLCFGILLSFFNSRRFAYGILSGGAVAICGASAALAFSAVLPAHPKRDSDTVLVVVAVTALSTIAMVLYPILCKLLELSELQTGFLIGATIHDVAQVVGAGYSVSDDAGLIATLVKMVRVACLPLMVLVVFFSFSDSQQSTTKFPWFLVLFIALCIVRSTLPIPEFMIAAINDLSRWLLVIAIAALGLKTNLAAVFNVHFSLLIILLLETVFILGLALLFVTRFLA